MITVTAFKWVPPFAQGPVGDLRERRMPEAAQRLVRRAARPAFQRALHDQMGAPKSA